MNAEEFPPPGLSNRHGFVGMTLMLLGTGALIYLLGFSLLVLFPAIGNAAGASGMGDFFEMIYSPIFRLMEYLNG